MHRYKVILSSNTVYKEVELPPSVQRVKVGTGIDCDVRLHKDLFFGQIEITFMNQGEQWSVVCSDNLYLTSGDVIKLITKKLNHGESFEIRYQDSNNLVFNMDFLIDFDDGKIQYNRVIDVSGLSDFAIGYSSDCVIQINSEFVKNDKVILSKNADGYSVKIENTSYGVYINGKKAKTGSQISNMDFLSISDFFFYFKDGHVWTGIHPGMTIHNLNYSDSKLSPSYPKFNRNTRMHIVLDDSEIEILDPPAKPEKQKQSLASRLVPSIGMMLVSCGMATMGGTMIIMSILSASMSIVTTVITLIENSREFKKQSKERIEKYNTYIDRKRTEIQNSRDEEKQLLDDIYLGIDKEKEMFETFSPGLFERTRDDEDYLCVRLGQGEVEAKRKVSYKKQEKLEIEDNLQEMPESLCKEFKYIHYAPVSVDLKKVNAIGVVGSSDYRIAMMRNIVVDLIARQYYTDVKMVFVAEKEHEDEVNEFRILPYVIDSDTGLRMVVTDDESKNLVFEYLYKLLNHRDQHKNELKDVQNIIVFFYDELGFKNHPISKFVDRAKELHVTFVFFGTDEADIPVGCGYLISQNGNNGMLISAENRNNVTAFEYPSLTGEELHRIIELMAPVYTEEVSLEGSLTKNISMFEMMNILAVDDLNLKERWEKTQVYKSMAAPIGVSKSGMVYLDLHDKYHGPHGLVAGTTGSGKSEVLQTYILSMATLFHPYEVGFVIIDFKGGGMVNQFKDLPHLMGAITNIDGKEIDRSLKSIKAELQKRQRLFAEAEVNHIDKYIKKFKKGEVSVPIPHLILIVDEFAELKADQPEFMKELISAARIGRSLGVHLILATQKPSGQVDDQIWSNSKFKLCLKVQSQEDSNEVLKSPLAAEIKEPGRAYLQVGNNEIFELFQSAYSGAPERTDDTTTKEFNIYGLTTSGRKVLVYSQKRKKSDGNNKSQLDAIVEYVAEYCKKNRISALPNICLPSLSRIISYPEDDLRNGSKISIGVYDDPDNQIQGQALIDVENRNAVIIGSSQFGKTNLLQSIIRTIASTYSAKQASIYILDFASMVLKNYENLNHVGGVVTSSEDEKLNNLFKLLLGEINSRKQKLLSAGVSSFASYLEAGYQDLPHIYVIVDNMTALNELYLQDNDSLLTIVREGIAVGISTILTNPQINGIGYRYLSNFSTKIALYCNDSGDYVSLYEKTTIKPDEVPGRCVFEMDKRILECQTYLAFEGEKEYERVSQIHQFIEKTNSANRGLKAKRIPFIPSTLTEQVMKEDFGALSKGYSLPVGLTYREVEPFYLDVAHLGVFGLCAKDAECRMNFVNYLMTNLENNRNTNPVQVVIYDDISRSLDSWKNSPIVSNYSLNGENLEEVLGDWHIALSKRYDSLMFEDTTEKNDPLLLMLVQNSDVAKQIGDNYELNDKFNEICGRYKDMNVSFIFTDFPNSSIGFDSPEPFRKIKQEQNIMYFEDLDNLKSIDVPYEELKLNRKKLEAGDAYYIHESSVTKMKIVSSNIPGAYKA